MNRLIQNEQINVTKPCLNLYVLVNTLEKKNHKADPQVMYIFYWMYQQGYYYELEP